MTCLGQTDQLSVQVHRPVQLDLGVLDEVEKTVLLSAVSAETWCLLELSSWVELYWLLARGHWHPMSEHLRPLPMH